MLKLISEEIKKTQQIMQNMATDTTLLQQIEHIANRCIVAIRAKNKIFFAGNGGSAADSQHLAAELVGRLCHDRPGMAALALTTDTSALTAVGNDYGFENIFSRQVEALGQPGDVLIGISTSGASPNILQAFKAARNRSMVTVGFTGRSAPLMNECCDAVLNIPSQETSKIQECHIVVGHIVCALIEMAVYGEQYNLKRSMPVVS